MSSQLSMYAAAVVAAASGGSRPAPQRQAAIAPPFDQTDGQGNLVHTTLPPEKTIPDHFTDPLFMRADFNGVTLPGSYVKDGDGWTITDGRWTGLHIPFLNGANSTPPTMIMTPQLWRYPLAVQIAVFTEHAERAYDDFIFDVEGWGGPAMTIDQAQTWVAVIQSWGFRPVLWRGNPNWTDPVDDMLQALMAAGITFYVHGEEADSKTNAENYEIGLQKLCDFIQRRIPIAAHFTAEPGPDQGGRGMGYPLGFPRDTFILDWSRYDGQVHLALQLNVNSSAGLQGVGHWYARRRLMGVGDGARGSGAPNSRVITFETKAFAQLMGQCDENTACRFNWENGCGTRDDTRSPGGDLIPPVGGFGNGNRYPNGDPL